MPFAAVATLLIIGIAILRFQSQAKLSRVESHLAENKASLANAVHTLIAANSPGHIVKLDSLPTALAAADVKFAICQKSHVSLIVNTTPDTESGIRVWIGEPEREFSDSATSTAGVYRFKFSNDEPESASNRPG